MFASISETNERYQAIIEETMSIGLPVDLCRLIGVFENQWQFVNHFGKFIEGGGVLTASDHTTAWIMTYNATEKGREVSITYPIHGHGFTISRRSMSARAMWDFITGAKFPSDPTAKREPHVNVASRWRDEIRRLLSLQFIGNEAASIARQRFAGRTAI